MENEEPIEHQNIGEYCRLCLDWIDDKHQFIDIASFNDDLNSTLADKIRDCVGLYINPDDIACRICSNCEQTIRLIDEFRILCHQSANLFESTQFRYSDAKKWECYNKHITELRVLVWEQRDRVDNILKETTLKHWAEAPVGIVDDILPPEFIKVEEEVEPLAIELDGDPNESISVTTEISDNGQSRTIKDRDSKYRLKLEIARELQTQTSKKPNVKAVSKKLNLELEDVRRWWREMQNYYRIYKKRAYAEHKLAVFRCRECPLFAAMDILIPKFYGDEPYREPQISNGKIDDENLISTDLKVALAEEIKKHPELWDLSLNCSTHSINTIWKEMTKKFSMDVRMLRKHWKRLRVQYRSYQLRRTQNPQMRKPTNEKYAYLMSILHEMCEDIKNTPSLVGSIEQHDVQKEEIEKVVEKGSGEGQFIQKKRQLPLSIPKEYDKCNETIYGDDRMDNSSNSKPTGDDTPKGKREAYVKRRYTGKRSFSDVGCIRTKVNGQMVYAKVCELCGKQVERSRFEVHMNMHNGLRPYLCSFEGCNRRYVSKTIRDRHEILYHGEDGYIFPCDQCDEKFKLKSVYEYHYALKHKNENVPCNICGKVFKHKSILRDHMRVHKTNYECHICGKILQKKYTLNGHMRTHTNEKPYPCGLCEQRFIWKVQMKNHMLKVHGVEFEEVQEAITTIKS
ncbi:zinc finger protein 283-like [Toxorhynchites rutilus septentrionalis]|uniref:zinc finger protein 283-like n=1 Tax=Toxorhynchites rutilus septentrionalis TaxID=329112 RepID=UPI002478EFD1|nr:zinc finger protein 283-like [Toxorhynchites rutilus septentrionalis]XP_055617085.1 zinc finger protein 283-like [Toxorhynchites rutilus septentrionalis]